MLSLFPELLDWSFFAPTILRLALAFLFWRTAWEIFAFARTEPGTENARSFPLLALLLAALSVLFFTGALVQVAAAVGFSFALVGFIANRRGSKYAPKSRELYALVMVVSFSLIILGAGAYAIDLPL